MGSLALGLGYIRVGLGYDYYFYYVSMLLPYAYVLLCSDAFVQLISCVNFF